MAVRAKELYQRGPQGIWHFRFTNSRTAAQERGSTRTADKQLAQQRLDEIKANAWTRDIEDEKLAQERKQREEDPKLWIEATTKWMTTKKSKRSIGDDIYKINVLAPALDLIPLNKITDDLIQKLVVDDILAKRDIEDSTVNRYLDLIRSILKASERWNYLDKAPILEKPGIIAEKRRKAWLTVEQYKRAKTALSPLHSRLMTLSLCTGMRVANVIKLEVSEVDIKNKRIFIPAEKIKGKVDHTVPLNKTAIELLELQLQELADLEKLKPLREPRKHVFQYKGRPFKKINMRGWHSVFDKIGVNDELRNAGLLSREKEGGEYIEKFVFHGMRHTFATWLVRTGVPREIIGAIGGWSSGSKTKMVDIYTHIEDVTHLLPFVRNIDQILAGKKHV